MRKLKVYGGCLDGMNRTIVAATSKKIAAQLCKVCYNHFNSYATETGNKEELDIALSSPQTVFKRNINISGAGGWNKTV
jgi:hypothetical protein